MDNYVAAEEISQGNKITVVNCLGCVNELIVKKIDKGDTREIICPSCETKLRVKKF